MKRPIGANLPQRSEAENPAAAALRFGRRDRGAPQRVAFGHAPSQRRLSKCATWISFPMKQCSQMRETGFRRVIGLSLALRNE